MTWPGRRGVTSPSTTVSGVPAVTPTVAGGWATRAVREPVRVPRRAARVPGSACGLARGASDRRRRGSGTGAGGVGAGVAVGLGVAVAAGDRDRRLASRPASEPGLGRGPGWSAPGA